MRCTCPGGVRRASLFSRKLPLAINLFVLADDSAGAEVADQHFEQIRFGGVFRRKDQALTAEEILPAAKWLLYIASQLSDAVAAFHERRMAQADDDSVVQRELSRWLC